MKQDFYKGILEKSPVGYANHKIIYDEWNKPVDYEYVEVNNAFLEATKLNAQDIIGRLVSEVCPVIDSNLTNWIKIYNKIPETGESFTFEQYADRLERWYRVNAYCPENGYLISLLTDITQEKKELEEKETIMTTISDVIFILGESFEIINILSNNDSLLFRPREELLNQNMLDVLPPQLSLLLRSSIEKAIQSGKKEYLEYPSPLPGDERWFEALLLVKDIPKGRKNYIVSVTEITSQKRTEEMLQQKTEELERFFQINLDLLCIADLEGNFIRVNEAWSEILGYTKDELEKRKFLEFIHPDDMQSTLDAMEKLGHNEKVILFVNRYKCKDGSYRYIEWCSQPYGELIYAAARDITERMNSQEAILYLSFHDQLTGVYNRRYYEEALLELDTKKNLPLSLIMGDVNGLKMANDAFGHTVGDRLLKGIAEAIKKECRADDIVARVGGDEFVIILPKAYEKDAESFVNRISAALVNQRVDMLELSISFGWATKQFAGENIEEIFKRAEENMYQRKIYESHALKGRIIETVLNTLFHKLPEEKKHAESCSMACQIFGRKLGLDQEDLEELRIAGKLHDIGKITVKDTIFTKSQSLDESEWADIRSHAESGYWILNTVSETTKIAQYTLSHHENWDGTGYPNGLKGEEIPLQSRMLRIVDSYYAMISERPYRKEMSREDAVKELKKYAGSQFDPDIVRVFIEQVLKEISN